MKTLSFYDYFFLSYSKIKPKVENRRQINIVISVEFPRLLRKVRRIPPIFIPQRITQTEMQPETTFDVDDCSKSFDTKQTSLLNTFFAPVMCRVRPITIRVTRLIDTLKENVCFKFKNKKINIS